MNNQLIGALPVVDTGVELCAVLTFDRPKYVTTVHTGGSAGVDPPAPVKKQFKIWIQNAPNLMPCINMRMYITPTIR